MGFFKEFKEDLTQAVNELMPEDEFSGEEPQEELDDGQIVDLLHAEPEPLEEPEGNAAAEPSADGEPDAEQMEQEKEEEPFMEPEPAPIENAEKKEEEEIKELERLDEEMEKETVVEAVPAKEEEPRTEAAPEKAGPENGNVTIITKGTKVNGSIESDGSLEVRGTVTGDIECLGKLTIEGNVAGNSKAAEIFVTAPKMKGNINSDGAVKVGLGTIVVGDVKGSSSVIAGAVKGDIDVDGPVIIDSTAIVKGNITAKSVQINNGAVIDGYCSLSYSDVAIDDFFEDELG